MVRHRGAVITAITGVTEEVQGPGQLLVAAAQTAVRNTSLKVGRGDGLCDSLCLLWPGQAGLHVTIVALCHVLGRAIKHGLLILFIVT